VGDDKVCPRPLTRNGLQERRADPDKKAKKAAKSARPKISHFPLAHLPFSVSVVYKQRPLKCQAKNVAAP